MVPKILALQFRMNSAAELFEQQSISREIGESATVHFVSALDVKIRWDAPEELLAGYHGLILGGSGDFDFDGGRSETDSARLTSYQLLEQLRPLCQSVFDQDLPTFGICYGHQLLGAFRGARVVHDVSQKKNCSHVVAVVGKPTEVGIFTAIPASFYAHYGHKDTLDRIPDGAVLVVCGGDLCRVSALRYQANIYSTQFHPELTFDDMLLRSAAFPGYLPEGVSPEDIFIKDTHSNTILQNFGRLVATYAQQDLLVPSPR